MAPNVTRKILIGGLKFKLLLLKVEALVEKLDAAAVVGDLDRDDLVRRVRTWRHLDERRVFQDCFTIVFLKFFSHLLPKQRNYSYVCLIDGAARIFSNLLCPQPGIKLKSVQLHRFCRTVIQDT